MMINQGFRALCAAAFLGAASAGVAAADELVLPSEVAATHWKTDYQNEFAQKVGERTGGAIDVKVFPAGQLYNEQDALAALGTGACVDAPYIARFFFRLLLQRVASIGRVSGL